MIIFNIAFSLLYLYYSRAYLKDSIDKLKQDHPKLAKVFKYLPVAFAGVCFLLGGNTSLFATMWLMIFGFSKIKETLKNSWNLFKTDIKKAKDWIFSKKKKKKKPQVEETTLENWKEQLKEHEEFIKEYELIEETKENGKITLK